MPKEKVFFHQIQRLSVIFSESQNLVRKINSCVLFTWIFSQKECWYY